MAILNPQRNGLTGPQRGKVHAGIESHQLLAASTIVRVAVRADCNGYPEQWTRAKSTSYMRWPTAFTGWRPVVRSRAEPPTFRSSG